MMITSKRLTLQCFQWWSLRKDYHCSVFNDELFEKIDIVVFSMMNSSKRLSLQCFHWFNSSKRLTLQCFQCWALRKDYHCSVFNDERFETINITVFSMIQLFEKINITVFSMLSSTKRLSLQCFQWWTLRIA